jgi:crotonobetainyl-CoA:carnitine CoA-transferase CaiB-like acyl-CoA transferase
VPIAPVLDPADVLAAAHYRERGAIAELELAPGVRAEVPTGFVELDGTRAGIRRPAPALGEHDAEVDEEWSAPRATPDPSALGGEPRRPLAGLRVLDLGVIVLGAEVARLFADQGAEVIKVESSAYPDGARESAYGFALGHRNCQSIGLNLRDPQGVALFKRLVAASDVVLSNFKPGTLEKLGLGPDVLREANPRLVTVASSAVGATGEWRGWAGYGPLVRCAAAVTSRWRYADDPGAFGDGTTIYPDHYGARVAAVAGLAALIACRGNGHGSHVRSSQAEAILAEFPELLAHESLVPGATAVPPGNAHDGAAPWGVYPCAGDDEWCAITVRDDDDWRRLRAALGEPGWTTTSAYDGAPGRVAARAAIDAELSAWTRVRRPREVAELLQRGGVPAGHMQRVEQVREDPQLHARGFFRTFEQPGVGSLVVENGPFVARAIPDPPCEPAPRFGEQTRELCARLLGLAESEVERLLAAGVLEAAAEPVAR